MDKPKQSSSSIAPLLPPPSPPSPPSFSRQETTSLRYLRHSPSLLFSSLSLLTLLAISLFLLYPSHPDLHLDRITINKIHVSLRPSVTVTVYLRLRIRIRNPDFFSLDYNLLEVSIGYRGEALGSILSAGGKVRARGVSYVDAEMRIEGIEVLHNVFYLIEDVGKGAMAFDTVTGITGVLHFVFFDIPVKETLSCAVTVNPKNHTVLKKDCYLL